MKIRTYSELIRLSSFEDRFTYLKLNGIIGKETFGFDRWINQIFYRSDEWKAVRREIILRDNGCDLGLEGYEIQGPIHVHHMNPIDIEDIVDLTEYLMNPEYLISSAALTHKAIHYGNKHILRLYPIYPVERRPNDMIPWKEAM